MRKVGALLGIGIFLFPFFFVWVLLRSGHSTLARIVGFAWFGVFLLVGFTGANSTTPDPAVKAAATSSAPAKSDGATISPAEPASAAKSAPEPEASARALRATPG